VSTEILVNAMPYETRVVIVDHGLPQEIYIERARRRGLVGNIYKGRVVRVLPGMQAAFVDIGDKRTAFLHAADVEPLSCLETGTDGAQLPGIQTLLSEGESVLTQVLKDPLGAKGARVTTRISVPSRYMVYVPGGRGIGVSSRIRDPEERERLQHLVELVGPPEKERVPKPCART
jgi:ribonuclease G